MAIELKRRLCEAFKNHSQKTVTPDQSQLAEDYLDALTREQGPEYVLDLELINVDDVLEKNANQHSKITLAFEVLLNKYIINLLLKPLPRSWWSVTTRNPQFTHRIQIMKGWKEIMETVGYSAGDASGTLCFPEHQRKEPDTAKIALVATELLLAKADIKRRPNVQKRSNFAISNPSSQPADPPLAQPPGPPLLQPSGPPLLQPAAPPLAQEGSYRESMGFPTSHFEDHNKFAGDYPEQEDSSYYTASSEQQNDLDTVPPLQVSQSDPAISDADSTSSDVLDRAKKLLESMRDRRPVHSSSPAAVMYSVPVVKDPSKERSTSLQPAKVAPVPKKRTKLIAAVPTIPEDHSLSSSSSTTPPPQRPVPRKRRVMTAQLPAQPSNDAIPICPLVQDRPSPEYTQTPPVAGATASKPALGAKDAAEAKHFSGLTPSRQREYLTDKCQRNERYAYLIPYAHEENRERFEKIYFQTLSYEEMKEYFDCKQERGEPVRHLIPLFKESSYFKRDCDHEHNLGKTVFAYDQNPQDEKKMQKMERDGEYLLRCVKKCAPLGFSPEEVQIFVQKGRREVDPVEYMRNTWLNTVKNVQDLVQHKVAPNGRGVQRPSQSEARQRLIDAKGDQRMAANECFKLRVQKINDLLLKLPHQLEVTWDEAAQALSVADLDVNEAFYVVQCRRLQPLYDFIFSEYKQTDLMDRLKDEIIECKEKEGEEYQATLRMVMAECRLPTTAKAELLVKLIEDRDDYPLKYYVDAAQNYSNFEDARKFLNQPCPICMDEYLMDDMITMPTCGHSVCKDCFKDHFKIVIKEQSVKHFTCPICDEPDMMIRDQTLDMYRMLLVAMIKANLDKAEYDLCSQKLTDYNLSQEPGFVWCTNQECKSGFVVEQDLANVLKVECPNCHQSMCFKCKKKWEEQHQGISCAQFAHWKASMDPDAQKAGLAAHLNENGIECPKCKFRYDLARGGCMHFKCTQCPNEFCSGCGNSFKKDQACGKFESCRGRGLHAHHPRDCLYYMRDIPVDQLQKLLADNNIDFDTEPPEAQVNADNDKEEEEEEEEAADEEAGAVGGGAKQLRCRVMLQKETPNGLVDEECGIAVPDKMAGLCKTHYKEYLVNKINKNKLDPLELLDNDEIIVVLRREERKAPEREHEEKDEEYRQRLIEFVQEEFPLERAADDQ